VSEDVIVAYPPLQTYYPTGADAVEWVEGRMTDEEFALIDYERWRTVGPLIDYHLILAGLAPF
jgi:hypothetical protein